MSDVFPNYSPTEKRRRPAVRTLPPNFRFLEPRTKSKKIK